MRADQSTQKRIASGVKEYVPLESSEGCRGGARVTLVLANIVPRGPVNEVEDAPVVAVDDGIPVVGGCGGASDPTPPILLFRRYQRQGLAKGIAPAGGNLLR